jgi:hypothetical protein
VNKYKGNSDKSVMNSHYLTLVHSHLRFIYAIRLYFNDFISSPKNFITDDVQRPRRLCDLYVELKGVSTALRDTSLLLRAGHCTLSISWSNLILTAKVWSIVRPGAQYNFSSQLRFAFSI